MRNILSRGALDNNLSNIKKKIVWAKDRITKGYCEYDSYEINSWFLQIVPDLIEIVEKQMDGTVMESFISNYLDEHHDSLHLTCDQYRFDISTEKQDEIFNVCVQEYHKVLKEMIFYLNEANPEKCSKKNEYQEDYYNYVEKRSAIGESLAIKDEEGNTIINTNHPNLKRLDKENKELIDNYKKRDEEIKKYQQKCKKKGLALFVKYFDDLGW